MALAGPALLPAAAAAVPQAALPAALRGSSPYAVTADAASPPEQRRPSVKKLDVLDVLGDISSQSVRAVFLGEHHDSSQDHQLQEGIIRALAERREVAVGLEAIQRRFQPVLDAYSRGELTEAQLEEKTDWRKRWFWPFERYLPVFRTCKELNIPLVALNVDSEDLSLVEANGLPALDRETLAKYIPQPKVFGVSTQTVAFKTYASQVIKPSYDMHKRMGILRTTITGLKLEEDMTYRNFLSGRLLWDSAMGSRSAEWLKSAKPGTLLVGLIGGDHVKFGCGVPSRCAQALGSLDAVRAVMLNTTPIDTHDEIYARAAGENDALTLQMPFDQQGDAARTVKAVQEAVDAKQSRGVPVLSVADIVWYSQLAA